VLADRFEWWKRSSKAAAVGSGSRISVAALFKNRYVIVGLAVAASAILVFMIMRLFNPSRSTDSGRAANAPETARRVAIAPGSDAKLYIEGLDSIPVAVDEKGLDELINALSKKDGDRIDALTKSGKVIKVAKDTSARVIEMTTGKTRVRITEGQYIMQEGWILDRWVR
jgi:hypothetical protein